MGKFCKHDPNKACINNGNCGQCPYHAKGGNHNNHKHNHNRNKGDLNVIKPQSSISASNYTPKDFKSNEPYIDFKALYKIVMRLGVKTKIKRFF